MCGDRHIADVEQMHGDPGYDGVCRWLWRMRSGQAKVSFMGSVNSRSSRAK